MKQNDNLVKLAKITNTAASFLIFLAGLMLIFLPSTEVTSLQRTVLAVLFLLTGAPPHNHSAGWRSPVRPL